MYAPKAPSPCICMYVHICMYSIYTGYGGLFPCSGWMTRLAVDIRLFLSLHIAYHGPGWSGLATRLPRVHVAFYDLGTCHFLETIVHSICRYMQLQVNQASATISQSRLVSLTRPLLEHTHPAPTYSQCHIRELHPCCTPPNPGYCCNRRYQHQSSLIYELSTGYIYQDH